MRSAGNSPRGQAGSADAAWYCLQAKYKHEHIAAAHLREVKGVTVFCPRIRFKRQTRTRVAWVTEALFPGYLFAQFELTRMHLLVSYTQGVRRIVRFANRYPTIEGVIIDQLREHVGEKEIRIINYEPSQGDNVKIGEGAFAGLEAVITQILPAKVRVRLLVDFLGRKVEMELARSSVLRRET